MSDRSERWIVVSPAVKRPSVELCIDLGSSSRQGAAGPNNGRTVLDARGRIFALIERYAEESPLSSDDPGVI